MPGCGGLRKNAGGRPETWQGEAGWGQGNLLCTSRSWTHIHLITVYGKDQKEDLSADEKKLYRAARPKFLKDQSRRSQGEVRRR